MATSDQTATNEKMEKQNSVKSEMEDYPLPSNQDYLSYYVYQNEWRPTKPLRPIGAMSASPGPAIVNLPSTTGEKNHDPTKTKAPSYKMGQKLIQKDQRFGVGPGAYNINEVCKVTNMGKENNLAPKIGNAVRFRDKADVRSPGPAAYFRKRGDKFVYPSAPSFSMPQALRGEMRIPFSPAPNLYSLPTGIGPGKTPYVMGPSYSIGKAKRTDEKHEMNPGPAAYMLPPNNIYKTKNPSFYIGTKSYPPLGTTSSPGPGAYSTHLVKFDKYSTPRLTFGIRHSPFKALPGFAAEK